MRASLAGEITDQVRCTRKEQNVRVNIKAPARCAERA